MLWAFFSDVHSNLPALEAVLEAIEHEKPDRLLCLGDLVGYGPHPREVLRRVRSLDCVVISGNHDLAAIGALDTTCFNLFARQAVEWTAEELSKEDHAYLAGLPLTWEEGPVAAVHSTWDEPEEFHYVQAVEHAATLLDLQPRFLGVFGHTHVPLAFVKEGGTVTLSVESSVDLSEADRALVNVGSVGQPRDEDSRAAFVLFDDETRVVTVRRVSYAIEEVANDILAAGLPGILAERLCFGV